MINPLSALGLFALISLLAGLLFWPAGGLYWRWRQLNGLAESVRVEDTLKHLYHCEYDGRPGTLDSLAGVLEVPRDQAAILVERCQRLGLVDLADDRPVLTPEGRAQALHVIRVHRLWECYLAERTGVSPLEWHSQAERYEHTLSPAETEELYAALNRPSHDPHGDPIPTAEGRMPPPAGTPLSQLEPGMRARVLHVEDEPEAVYAQLAALELRPGVVIHMLDRTPKKVTISVNGREAVLATLVAANVSVGTVRRTEEGEVKAEPERTLASLTPGQSARVIRLGHSCRGLERERLLDLGFVPGTQVEAQMKGPLGDPIAYRVRGTLIALRREQAERVLVEEGV
ncbi:MAG: FeoA domain-containing protein [Vulcanimicrobiota bacterium]